MSFPNFWKSVGGGFASVAKGAASAALWASQHPEVVNSVASIAGHPEIGAIVSVAGGVTTAVVTQAAQGNKS